MRGEATQQRKTKRSMPLWCLILNFKERWLGREGSNLRMVESKSTALPLGYAPIVRLMAQLQLRLNVLIPIGL